ncbi:MAG: aspartate/glutamate racemase family protein [Pyrinomonadaceae bacterium MAG19_C2-C3]|nr:aspartate/glutamate racemase family protein [Pyrinomonadaceae bacterium MAG19_C2-C3]
MTKRKVAFVHTSPAAINPLMGFYSDAAPELEITNLLDDGILRLLSAKDSRAAQLRLADMLKAADETYEVELAMITCSSVSNETVKDLNDAFDLPVLKIDYPMARQAVKTGGRIGVAATFAPTLVPTSKLLNEAAAEAGVTIELVPEVEPTAYEALLIGDTATHDRLLLSLIERLASRDVGTIVLAQVSMARITSQLDGRIEIPVLSSLQTSLEAVRETLAEIH